MPVVGVIASLILFVVATTVYPGGSYTSSHIVGYDWTHHYICTLFHATALNGAPNPSRYYAVPALLLVCISIAFVFNELSAIAPTRRLQKMIQIGGIGSMVYAFIAVTTPLHDLLVIFSLVFHVVAVVALLMTLHAMRRTGLFVLGAFSLCASFATAVLYYGFGLSMALAIMQKLDDVLSCVWVLVTYLALVKPEGRHDAASAAIETATGELNV